MVHRIAAKFELTTPAMAGGAAPDIHAELRTDAIIGQLRRWWWAKAPLGNGFSITEAPAIADALFGAAGNDNKRGQGAYLLNVTGRTVAPQAKDQAFDAQPNIDALFGLLWKSRKQAIWNADKSKRHFEVEFTLRPRQPPFPDQAEPSSQLLGALRLWGLLGGIGAGQRRGFGSVQFLQLKMDDTCEACEPLTKDSYRDTLKGVLGCQTTFPTTGIDQQFAAFTNRVPGAHEKGSSSLMSNVFISEESYKTGARALSAIAGAAADISQGEPIVDLFSEGKGRVPSPYHLHIVRLGPVFHVVASVLPRGNTTYSNDLIRRMNDLFKILNMKDIIP